MMADAGEHTPNPAVASFAQTVVGYSHKRRGLVCQDASCSVDDSNAAWHIAAVSDGHGDPTCPRSNLGSRLAVNAACETLVAFAESIDASDATGRTLHDDLLVPSRRKIAMRRLTDALIFSWRNKVVADYADNPLTDEESEISGPEATAQYERGDNIEHLYGATLICALWMDGLLVLIHQGDGACRVLHADGAMESPVPDDPRCYANVTTSLCDPDVAEGIRTAVLDLTESPVAACILASDGVENSFSSQAMADGFMKGLLIDVACGNLDATSEDITTTLSELSQMGSGDDMSLAALYDRTAISQASRTIAADMEKQRMEQRVHELENKLVSMERKRKYLKERSDAAASKLAQQELSLDELREAIRKRRESEELLGRKIEELKEERDGREWSNWGSGLVRDLKRIVATPQKKQQLDEYDTQMARESAALGADIACAIKAREDIRHKRQELEALLAAHEQEHDVDSEQAVREFEEYDARYRALEAEIAQIEQATKNTDE